MEAVLDLYTQPENPDRLLVCFDKTSKSLNEHYRSPMPAQPGYLARDHYQYARRDTHTFFLNSVRLQD